MDVHPSVAFLVLVLLELVVLVRPRFTVVTRVVVMMFVVPLCLMWCLVYMWPGRLKRLTKFPVVAWLNALFPLQAVRLKLHTESLVCELAMA